MQQISNHVYCDDFIATLKLETKLMPNPYQDYPYLIIKNFLSVATCDEIVLQTRKASDAVSAQIKKADYGVVTQALDTSIRSTKIYPLTPPFSDLYHASFLEHQNTIENFFAVALTTATEVQVLEYEKDDFYVKHADDSSEVINNEGETVGFIQVAPQRKITTVLFATSNSEDGDSFNTFSGGELIFNYLFDKSGKSISIIPQAGDLVVFPSNPIYSHEVLTVNSGYRLSIVQWHNAIVS